MDFIVLPFLPPVQLAWVAALFVLLSPLRSETTQPQRHGAQLPADYIQQTRVGNSESGSQPRPTKRPRHDVRSLRRAVGNGVLEACRTQPIQPFDRHPSGAIEQQAWQNAPLSHGPSLDLSIQTLFQIPFTLTVGLLLLSHRSMVMNNAPALREPP